jgi:hypothetical protein
MVARLILRCSETLRCKAGHGDAMDALIRKVEASVGTDAAGLDFSQAAPRRYGETCDELTINRCSL